MRDLKLDSSGELAVTAFDLGFIDSADQVTQRLRTRLRLFKGEWFLNLDAGTPWFQEILVKNPDLNRIEAILRKEILDTPEVNGILEFNLNYDPKGRSLAINFKVDTDFGVVTFRESVP